MLPEKFPRGAPSPRESPQRKKVTVQEVQVVFKAQYDRMNHQTLQLRRTPYC